MKNIIWITKQREWNTLLEDNKICGIIKLWENFLRRCYFASDINFMPLTNINWREKWRNHLSVLWNKAEARQNGRRQLRWRGEFREFYLLIFTLPHNFYSQKTFYFFLSWLSHQFFKTQKLVESLSIKRFSSSHRQCYFVVVDGSFPNLTLRSACEEGLEKRLAASNYRSDCRLNGKISL